MKKYPNKLKNNHLYANKKIFKLILKNLVTLINRNG